MGTQVTLKYTIPPDGAGELQIETGMKSVPVPPELLTLLGLRVTSDSTTVGASPVVRTIVISFVPTVTATGTSTLVAGASGSVVDFCAVTAPGDEYTAPPFVAFTGGAPDREARAKATLDVQTGIVLTAGVGYTVSPIGFVIGGMLPPTQGPDAQFTIPSCIQDFVVGQRGRGYSLGAIVQFEGGLGPGGVEATAVPTIVGGKVVAVTVQNPGRGYIRTPKVVIYDPGGGSGAKVSAQMGAGTPATVLPVAPFGVVTGLTIVTPGSGYVRAPRVLILDATGLGATARVTMGVGAITLIDRGHGYSAAPTVTLVPLFKSFYPDPDLVAQAKPFWTLMETAIGLACISPVVSTPPLVA